MLSDFFFFLFTAVHCVSFPASLTLKWSSAYSSVPFSLSSCSVRLLLAPSKELPRHWLEHGWQSSPHKRSPSTDFRSLCPNNPPFWGGNTVHGTCGHLFADFNKERLSRVLWEVEISRHCIISHWEGICLSGSWIGSALVSQCPSYHEFITAIQYQLLWYVWRVSSMAITFSGVPQGWMLGPLKFLFALLWIEGASACKLGPFIKHAFQISWRATVKAVGSGGLRCIHRLGLG